MPSLNDQLNSFKARMRSAPVLGKRTVAQAQPPKKDSPPPEPTEPKRQKFSYADSVIAPTSGTHLNTQLVHAIEYLKGVEKAVTFDELQDYLSFPVEPLKPLLMGNAHLRVKDGRIFYVSKLGIYSGPDLLRYLKALKTFQGVSVRDLKDGWSAAVSTVEDLEKEDKIIVLRNRKDNSPRLVFPNKGGAIGKVNPEFVGMWQASFVPTAGDLPGELEKVGLKPSSVDPSKIKRESKEQTKKPKRRTPRSRVTNTHMKGLLKDFS